MRLIAQRQNLLGTVLVQQWGQGLSDHHPALVHER